MKRKHGRRFLAMLMVGILALGNVQAIFAAETEAVNVLADKNTNFEGADDSNVPYWWYGSSAAISKDTTVGDIPEGSGCVKVEPQSAGIWVGCAMNVTDIIEEGKTYGYSFSARLGNAAENTNVSLVLNQVYADDFSDTELVLAGVENEPQFSADAWTKVSGSFTASASEGKEMKQLHIVLSSGDAAVPFYVDDLVIYEIGGGNSGTTTGDNLLQNPEFNDGTNGWYATGGTLEAVTGDDANTYAKISGRTANWNCVAQDITALVENNTDYAFSFDVRLADDYTESRVVQLCTTKKDSNDENEVYDKLTVKGGNATVTPGEWTTITGTLSVQYTGTLEKLEFKISEQGGAVAEGQYGSYEVDNVTLLAVEKEQLTIEEDIKDLKAQFAESFGGKAGVAIPYSALSDDARMALVTKHYNSITAENEMKPDSLLGQTPNIGADGYPVLNFSSADAMIDYLLAYNAANPENQILVRGHVLVWHSQTPEWFFHENYDAEQPYVSSDVMNARMENYIAQVMEHYHGEMSPYRGLIYAWDVVNEAINDTDGGLRTNSSWYNVYGDDEFVLKAFTYANTYAPADVKLFYNDYNETTAQKCEGICNLLEKIKVEPGARIDGMGMQGHYSMESPTIGQFEQAIRAYAAIVDEVQITELDMKSSSDYDGSNQAAEYTKQAYRYKDFFDKISALSKEGINISGVTIWGTHDGASWLQTSNSVGGSADGSRPQCPLFFDDNYKAKPAYWALVDPSRLEPSIQNITIIETLDNTAEQSEAVSYQRNGTEVTFKTAWDESGLHVWAKVADAQNTSADAVTVYIDKANTASDGAAVEVYTVNRSEATEVENGYEVELTIPMTDITVAEKIGFDIAVNNDGEIVSFNDLKNTQAASSKYYAQAIFKPYMTIEKGTVVVDGTMDKAWENVAEVPLTIVTGSVAASAKVKLLWDETNLYVYATVTDPVLNADSTDAYQQDSLEVFIDENNHKSDSYEADDKQYRISYENQHSFNGSECKEDYVTSEAVATTDGYVIEAAYAWTEINPQADTQIGLELQINEAGTAGSRTGTLSWYDESGMGWSAPSVFGTAMLVEKEETQTPGKNPGDAGEKPDDSGENTGNENKPGDGSTAPGDNNTGNAGTQDGNQNVTGQITTPSVDTWEQIIAKLSALAEKGSLTINMNGQTIVPQKLLAALRGMDKNAVFILNNGIKWTINGKTVAENCTDINLGVTVGAGNIPDTTITNLAKGRDVVRLCLAHDGSFGCDPVMTISLGTENAGLYAMLYHYNEENGKMEFVTSNQIGTDGYVSLTFTHASDYAIVLDSAATSSVDTSDNTNPAVGMILICMGLAVIVMAFKKKSA